MKEVWRKVAESPQYEVSNKNGFRNTSRNTQPKGRTDHWGYRRVNLGQGRERLYHIIIAKTFPEICGVWFNGCVVHHRNMDKLDNRPENLQVLDKETHRLIHHPELSDGFTTVSKEKAAAISKALKGKYTGDNCVTHSNKHIRQYTKDMKFIKEYQSIGVAAKENNCDISNISKALRGKMKTAYGFVWQYAV